jgi:hypothetical protein
MKVETREAIYRLPIVIIGWVIMDLWAVLVCFIGLIHWVYELVAGKRHKGMARFCNYFVTYMYNFVRYAALTTNKRPFPWDDFGKPIEKVDMKKKR